MNQIGYKDKKGKLRGLRLLPWGPLREIAKVLQWAIDVKGYKPFNWQFVENAQEEYTEALLRHIANYMDGERRDHESKLRTLAHIGCDVLFLLWFELKEEGPCPNNSVPGAEKGQLPGSDQGTTPTSAAPNAKPSLGVSTVHLDPPTVCRNLVLTSTPKMSRLLHEYQNLPNTLFSQILHDESPNFVR